MLTAVALTATTSATPISSARMRRLAPQQDAGEDGDSRVQAEEHAVGVHSEMAEGVQDN